MEASIRQLTDSKQALEYLSLKFLKTFGAGLRINVPKIEFGSELKAGFGAEFKTQLEFREINQYRSAMVKEIKKRKDQIAHFGDWSKTPAHDALVLLRMPRCSCFETMETADPDTGSASVVFYAGYEQDDSKNFVGMIGIREFTGPYLTDPDRRYTRNTGSEAFSALFGKEAEKPSRHKLFEEVATKLRISDWIGTQAFNAVALLNIIDFALDGPCPWTMVNIVYMVRDKHRDQKNRSFWNLLARR